MDRKNHREDRELFDTVKLAVEGKALRKLRTILVVWWVKYNTQIDTKMLASDYSSQSEASILVTSVSMG